MDIDKIIEGLNKKRRTLDPGLGNLEDMELTEVEKAFIKTYRPEKALIIYGTLAPGQPNHSVVEHIKGSWQQGIVRGKLENIGWGAELGYYGFRHTSLEEQEKIKAYVLCSDELEANWPALDEFEGDEYRRLLAKFELENGEAGIGNIYAINEEKV